MTAYLASRDVMRARTAEWHERYTLPSLWDFYEPSRENHGSYYYDWTSHDEIRWKNFYRVWMDLLDDYKDMGGRVSVSSDAGFIYNLFGFSTIEEMELLQEAGFHPLEVIRGATMHGAQALFEPKGQPIEFGVVREGLLADLVIVPCEPYRQPQGALTVVQATSASTPKLASRSASAGSSSRSRTGSSTTRGSCWRMWRGWWRSRRRRGRRWGVGEVGNEEAIRGAHRCARRWADRWLPGRRAGRAAHPGSLRSHHVCAPCPAPATSRTRASTSPRTSCAAAPTTPPSLPGPRTARAGW